MEISEVKYIMIDFKNLIEDYIEKELKTKEEKDKVGKLLLVDLKSYMEESNIAYEISVESLKVREEYRRSISDAFCGLLNGTTNSKEYTKNRLLGFSSYLKNNWKVNLELNEVFTREAINPYERLVDLLKTLNERMTKKELMEYYSINRKTLEKDLDKLIKGTKILGQKVKIRDIRRERNKITYQSSIHPVFLPLNLTEVYYLTVGLKLLSNDKETSINKVFEDLANRIYCQLSEYARDKMDKKGRQLGIKFPEVGEFQLYNGTKDEEKMARENKKSTLAFLWKSGIQCTIHIDDENMTIIPDAYIDYDIETGEVFLKQSLYGEIKEKIDIDKILDIEFSYK